MGFHHERWREMGILFMKHGKLLDLNMNSLGFDHI
jgi:hypothetical protein